jgi:alkyl sulfatase BDS1-like metallo-beta-lactamase superfamily hydrolase
MASESVHKRIESLLKEAQEAAAESDWVVVLNCAENVLRIESENEDARGYLAAAGRALGFQTNSSDDP